MEDTIAFKVFFGSPRDLEDARSIIVRQGERLHVERLLLRAAGLGVSEGVQDLLRQHGPR